MEQIKTLYDRDFYEWTRENAELLRQRRFAEIDLDNLVEEVESMGRSEKRAFINHLAVLITHLLKWQWQPTLRSKSWESTIWEQRSQTADILADNPSFKHLLDEALPRAYTKAIILFVKETDLLREVLPPACPYSFEEIMDEGFLPKNGN